MPYIITLIVLTLISYFFSQQIRKYASFIYIIIIALNVFVAISLVDWSFLIYQGFIGSSLMIIVMYASLIKKGTKLSKRLMLIRGELSIMSVLFLISHFWLYIFLGFELDVIIGVVGYVVMIPLFITSFKKIHKKIKVKNWKKLHKLSYLAYALIFLHLVLAASETLNLIISILIFGIYGILKFTRFKALNKR